MRKYISAVILTVLVLALSDRARANPSQDQSQKPAGGAQSSSSQGGQAAPAQNGQAATAGQGQNAQATPQITPEERKAYNDVKTELDLTRQAQKADDFAKKYQDQPVAVSEVYFFVANAAQQQNDINRAIDYDGKSLQVNPNNFMALLSVAGLLPQPQVLQGSDEEKEKKLAEAETDANKALTIMADYKPANIAPDQLAKLKAGMASEAHASLGMVHLQRATMSLTGADAGELAKSEQEFKQSVTGIDKPNAGDYFRLGEVYAMESKFDDAIDAYTQCSKLSQGQLQAMAGQQIDKLKKAKAQTAAPAKP